MNTTATGQGTASKQHLPELDLIKGIAISLVVLGHILIIATEYGRTALINILTSFHVPAFVFVTGYLSSREVSDWSAFWRKRSVQLLLPLLFVPALHVLSAGKSWEELIWNEYHAGYWFTYVLFLLFVPFCLFRYAYKLIRPRISAPSELTSFGLDATLGLLSLCLVLGGEWLLSGHEQLSGLLSLPLISWLYPYLLIGYFVARYELIKKLYTHPIVLALATAVAVATITLDFYGHPILRGIPRAMSSVCVLYSICIYLGGLSNRATTLLSRLGRESLGLYLWHYFFLISFPMREWVQYLSAGKTPLVWELIIGLSGSALVLIITYAWVQVLKFNPIVSRCLLGSKA